MLAFTISDSVLWSAIVAVIAALWLALRFAYTRMLSQYDSLLKNLSTRVDQVERKSIRCEDDRQLLYEKILTLLPEDSRTELMDAWSSGDTHVNDPAPGTIEYDRLQDRLKERRRILRAVGRAHKAHET